MQENSKEYPLQGGILQYKVHKNKVSIIGFSGSAARVEIPEAIENLPVEEIEKKAFLSKKTLTHVILPHTVTTIGDWAFAYCDRLDNVELADRDIHFGKSVFLDCVNLKAFQIRGREEADGALLAVAAVSAEAYYLLDVMEAGSVPWLAKWDAGMLQKLHSKDTEGYSKQVLCGEEDYGSTDKDAYCNRRRRQKVRLCLKRLLYPKGLGSETEREITDYLLAHTKGCASEEAWQVVHEEFGDARAYYELFAQIGCVNRDNLDSMLHDLGEDHPRMKAYLLQYGNEHFGKNDFFAALQL